MSDSTFLTRVVLENYKSIAHCDVELGPLNFLVGPNGAGKSNFLDALRFVKESLKTTLEQAVRGRNGVNEICRRARSGTRGFEMHFEFRLPDGRRGIYFFVVKRQGKTAFEVHREECHILPLDGSPLEDFFEVRDGMVAATFPATYAENRAAAVPDRLYLVAASGNPVFRPVFDMFSQMAFYNVVPDFVRETQSPDANDVLQRDGYNTASILKRIADRSPGAKARIEQYLAAIVPGIEGVDTRALGPVETLQFRQQVAGTSRTLPFWAQSMSDGTLRALAILVALFQGADGNPRVPLVGIEEPEIALHPAALGALLDSLEEASGNKQILITSHSADLLDHSRIRPEQILAVDSDEGATAIGPIDQAGRSVLADRLYTAGELLRLNQLSPSRENVRSPGDTTRATPEGHRI
jgi:predicted ATPase